jgi:hypothetical protein
MRKCTSAYAKNHFSELIGAARAEPEAMSPGTIEQWS